MLHPPTIPPVELCVYRPKERETEGESGGDLDARWFTYVVEVVSPIRVHREYRFVSLLCQYIGGGGGGDRRYILTVRNNFSYVCFVLNFFTIHHRLLWQCVSFHHPSFPILWIPLLVQHPHLHSRRLFLSRLVPIEPLGNPNH